MKKWIFLVFVMCLGLQVTKAQGDKKTAVSKDEFRAKQEAFLTAKAELTKDEAAKFFPVYFELQDKKKQMNNRIWDNIRKGKDPATTDAQYTEITDNILNGRIASDQLEKSYYNKFKKILPAKKLYKIQHAEMKFHRELLKNIKKGGDMKNNRTSLDVLSKRTDCSFDA